MEEAAAFPRLLPGPPSLSHEWHGPLTPEMNEEGRASVLTWGEVVLLPTCSCHILTEQPDALWIRGEESPTEKMRACGHQSQRAIPCEDCLRPCGPEPSQCHAWGPPPASPSAGAGHLQTPFPGAQNVTCTSQWFPTGVKCSGLHLDAVINIKTYGKIHANNLKTWLYLCKTLNSK